MIQEIYLTTKPDILEKCFWFKVIMGRLFASAVHPINKSLISICLLIFRNSCHFSEASFASLLEKGSSTTFLKRICHSCSFRGVFAPAYNSKIVIEETNKSDEPMSF